MTNIDKHPAGAFSWVELATTDQSGAKSFYTSLFGWSVTEFPMGPQDVYTIFRLQDRDAAAGYTMRPEERAQGIPSHWNLYVTVDNADHAASKAAELGGKVLQPAFDVMDAGRMAVVQDPTGAVFMVWQANKSTGIKITGVDGTFCWADLSTPDPEVAAKFYSGLFGWTMMKGEKDDYLHIKNGEDFIGGIPPAAHRKPGVPPHWLVYFYVSDVEGTATKAKELGATIYMPPRAMENVGTISILADPQGAVFAIFKSARK
jgi:predicted enzyme related to lactoylglutathione lyase